MTYNAIKDIIENVYGGEELFSRVVPILDLKERQGRTNYIDFLEPEDFGNTPGAYRGKDIRGRMFYTMCVEQKLDNTKPHLEVFTLFQRYPGNDEIWCLCFDRYAPIFHEFFITRYDTYKPASMSDHEYDIWYPLHTPVRGIAFSEFVRAVKSNDWVFTSDMFYPPTK